MIIIIIIDNIDPDLWTVSGGLYALFIVVTS